MSTVFYTELELDLASAKNYFKIKDKSSLCLFKISGCKWNYILKIYHNNHMLYPYKNFCDSNGIYKKRLYIYK